MHFIDNILNKILVLFHENKKNDTCDSIYWIDERWTGIHIERYIDSSFAEPKRWKPNIYFFICASAILALLFIASAVFFCINIQNYSNSLFFSFLFFLIVIALSVYVFIDGFYLLHKIKMQEKSEKETISSLINQIDFSLSNKKMLEEKMLNNPILAEILDRKYAKKFYIPICGFFSKFYLCERTNTVLISVQDLYFSTFIGLLPLLLLNAIVWVFFAIFYPSISTLGYIIFALSWIVILYSIICFLIGIIIFVKLKKKKVNFLDRVPKKRD